jgi:DNA-binding MarR family transcriptional regulator
LTAAAPRAGSKLAEVVGLLGREGGASIDELIAATDWLPHTTRAALTGLRKRGYAIERRREDDATRYWLASPGIHGTRGADESISNEGSSGIAGLASVGARVRPAKAA